MLSRVPESWMYDCMGLFGLIIDRRVVSVMFVTTLLSIYESH